MSIPAIDTEYLTQFLVDLLNIPSPTEFTEEAIAFVEKELSAYSQLKLTRTRKGTMVAVWEGVSHTAPRALTADVDTLGAMARSCGSMKSSCRWQVII